VARAQYDGETFAARQLSQHVARRFRRELDFFFVRFELRSEREELVIFPIPTGIALATHRSTVRRVAVERENFGRPLAVAVDPMKDGAFAHGAVGRVGACRER
jgi:hypothetical protein